MADPYHHAVSSVKKWGGEVDDYLPIHKWFDATKAAYCDQRHRAVLHNSYGIELCIQVFGQTLTLKNGKQVPVRWVGEQHVVEDCGFVPTLKDWLDGMTLKPWGVRGARQFSRTINLMDTLTTPE